MKTRSLSFKMYLIMSILVVGSIVIAAVGLYSINHINAAIHQMATEHDRVSLVKDLRSLFYLQLMNERAYVDADTSDKRSAVAELMSQRHQEVLAKIDELYKISSSVGKGELDKFKENYGQWWASVAEVKAQIAAGERAQAIHHMEEVGARARQKSEVLIDDTIARNEGHMKEEVKMAENDYARALSVTLTTSLVTICLGFSIGFLVLRSLNKSISEIIENLSLASEQVTAASQQIATAAVDLSESATEQASALEETVATIEELTSMVKANSDNAGQAALIAGDASNVAVRGEKEMSVLITSMKEISQDSKKISEIITVIDDIAFQTNLLALNAAVEAARAGEQGKGFAIVAEAVRTLAQRSAVAAKDISDLIKSSVGRMESGGAQVEKSGAVLSEILSSINKVTQLNQEISTASSEQANGIAQISQAMNQMDQVTQVNAASSEEAAASAEELSAQAQSMTLVIHKLVRVIRGEEKVNVEEPEYKKRPSTRKVPAAA